MKESVELYDDIVNRIRNEGDVCSFIKPHTSGMYDTLLDYNGTIKYNECEILTRLGLVNDTHSSSYIHFRLVKDYEHRLTSIKRENNIDSIIS